ncbi:hypothetical protein Ahy_B09g098955 [Arachis hypogaea]|uniref:Transposase MuDR plant domain-containing protein n=1 Tax=Arachis hypogaea TaxID=3818 RepID=A0A444XSJ7_ARAHY|nr:hypothetical protein Ahy_B09g098955 [Arachis hypogaea]
MAEQVMELSAKVGDVGGGGSIHSTYVQEDRPLAPPIHVGILVEDMEVGEEDSDEEYVVDSDFPEGGYEEEFVLEKPTEIAVGHRFKCRDALIQSVKNYSIRSGAEYQVIKSDRLKYYVHCRQAANECPWSLRVVLQQYLGYW